MENPELNSMVERSNELAKQYPGRESEVFTAVLTAELLKSMPLPQAEAAHVALVVKQQSIQEVLRDRKPSNDVERTLIFGHYLEAYKGMANFTGKDIVACFKEAREPVPVNVSDKILMNVKKGWFMTTGGKREGMMEYTLTNTGLQAAQQGFNKNKGD